MSWGNNGQNGQQQNQRKIPNPGEGKLREVDKSRSRNPDKAPTISGLINVDGHIIDVAGWYYPPKANGQGQMMPGTFLVKANTYDPNRQSQQQAPQQPSYGQPPQQTGYYAPPQHGGYPQQQPQGYQPPNTGGGYAPDRGYTPPNQNPQHGQPQQPQGQPGRWGGNPGQPQNNQGGGRIPDSEVPFAPDR